MPWMELITINKRGGCRNVERRPAAANNRVASVVSHRVSRRALRSR